MTLYLKSKNTYQIASEESLDIHHTLPPGNYSLRQSLSGFYLEKIDDFEIKGKIYGDTIKMAERIFNTYSERDSSTGLLLSGEKGSGKTLLMKILSVMATQKGIPTILINSNYTGEEFNITIQQIDQPCIICIDEFEKTYPDKEQEKLLTLLGGVYKTKKLFIFTANDTAKINEYFMNRPERMFYHLKYKGLSEEFIREYCKDNLNDLNGIDEIVSLMDVIENVNFDIIQSLVEEMNRYKESAKESIKFLNIKPNVFGSQYRIINFHPVHPYFKKLYSNTIFLSFRDEDFFIEFEINQEDGGRQYSTSEFKTKDFSYNKNNRILTYKNEEGDVLELKKLMIKPIEAIDNIMI